MKLSIDCLPCLVNQAVTQAKLHLKDEGQQFALVEKVMRELLSTDKKSAPCVAREMQRVLREFLQNPDPYREQKRFYNREMLKLEDDFLKLVADAEDPLEMGMRLAVAGNIIDFGPNQDLSREKVLGMVRETLAKEYDREAFAALKDRLAEARTLLYLGDNCGEIVFDKLFIRTIKDIFTGLNVVFATRGAPTLNDITEEDAYGVGMDRYAGIINNGADIPGTVLEECSPEFLQVFRDADMVIAKGQGNFESLYDECDKEIYFIFLCKCNVFEARLGVRRHDIVLMANRAFEG